MADKNNKENQNSKKRYKFIGIFLIALLLLFIGLAGYYLERDLEPVPDDQLQQSQELEEDESSSSAESDGVKESEVQEEDDQTAVDQSTESDSDIQGSQKTEEQAEETAGKDSKDELEQDSKEKTSDLSQEEQVSDDQEKEQQLTEAGEEAESLSKGAEKKETAAKESTEIEKKDKLDEQSVADQKVKEEINDKESGTEVSEKEKDKKEAAEKETQKDSEEMKDAQPENEGLQELDTDQSVDSPESEDSQKNGETQISKEGGFEEELEDSSFLDKILSILGLSESDFSQDLNILFVGLDDEESVSLGTIEADSIMIGKLRPEENSLKIKNIDEDTVYKNQLLREYHNGDIKKAVEEITDVKLDYHVYINYQGFESVIDELGGVQINLDQAVEVPALGLDLKEGNNLLSGKEALNFIRWKGSDEISRFERQKLLINSVMNKLRGNNILFDIKELYNTIVESYNSIETDINPVLAAEIFNYVKENDEFRIEFSE